MNGWNRKVGLYSCTAMVGQENTVKTSLNAMNKDTFEVGNFKDKKMVPLNDTEEFRGSFSRIKQMTGQDRLSGRRKFANETYDFVFEGLIAMFANFPLLAVDSSGAMERRMNVVFTNKPVSPLPLPLAKARGAERVIHLPRG
jgi:phage/plasmid-associated DNA primase